ncbi:MAG: hypothetical protein Q7R77_03065 [Candidatus Daviesbacteria bacterium]|nr:hypothetical protein [Candidatus Daviesbacteria bacterium]
MIDERFVFLAVALNLFGGSTYLIDTIKGKVRPNKVTWFLWTLAPFIAFAAQVKQGVGLVSLMTMTAWVVAFFIFFASFLNKKADWKITTFDLTCGLLSLIGLALWGITQVGNLAILFSILADGLAAIPIIVKSYRAPETENSKTFLFGAISALITLFTIKQWDFAHYAFSMYILFICLILFVLIKFKIGKKIHLQL